MLTLTITFISIFILAKLIESKIKKQVDLLENLENSKIHISKVDKAYEEYIKKAQEFKTIIANFDDSLNKFFPILNDREILSKQDFKDKVLYNNYLKEDLKNSLMEKDLNEFKNIENKIKKYFKKETVLNQRVFDFIESEKEKYLSNLNSLFLIDLNSKKAIMIKASNEIIIKNIYKTLEEFVPCEKSNIEKHNELIKLNKVVKKSLEKEL